MEWYFNRGHLRSNSFKCVSLTSMKEEIKSVLQPQSLDGSRNTNQANPSEDAEDDFCFSAVSRCIKSSFLSSDACAMPCKYPLDDKLNILYYIQF